MFHFSFSARERTVVSLGAWLLGENEAMEWNALFFNQPTLSHEIIFCAAPFLHLKF